MNFTDSVKYLLSLGNEVSAMKLGLENIHKLLAALGNPQKQFLKVQVAGTNGKGSVCAFLDSICVSAGIQTGLYTSPHLISITERIRIDGRDVSEEDFARHATVVRETAERLLEVDELEYLPTFFEQVTAIALSVFAEANVELAILETGLGGRLDATTAANAEIAAITSIDYDHQEYLGETLAEIAGEKAAIIHQGSRVVIGRPSIGAIDVVLKRCSKFGIDPRLAADVEVVTKGGNTSGSECVNTPARKHHGKKETPSLPVGFPPLSPIDFVTESTRYENVSLGLIGRHQIENAKVAILLAETLQDHFTISSKNIIDGLQKARHPGRLEYQGRFLLDGAHNVAGARALREYLDEFVTQPITMIFGAMRNKDIGEIATILFPKSDNLILTKPDNSRALTAKQLSGFVAVEIDPKKIFLTDTVAEAIEIAKRINDENGLILVTGSLYLVGDAIKILQNESET